MLKDIVAMYRRYIEDMIPGEPAITLIEYVAIVLE